MRGQERSCRSLPSGGTTSKAVKFSAGARLKDAVNGKAEGDAAGAEAA